ncbi:SEC-C metal-binding domain-containing protein, partial [Patescibacteria group bacterium]
SEVMRTIERFAYLSSIDHHWIEHIDRIDGLRESVRTRAYAQRDPLVEFKGEAYDMFEGLLERVDSELSRRLFRIGVAQKPQEIPIEQARTNVDQVDAMGLAQQGADQTAEEGKPVVKRPVQISQSSGEAKSQVKSEKKIGRNDPCWCGSGKKFKKCHYPQEG